MLDRLLETKQARQRNPIGSVISLVLHVLVIAAAVRLTQKTAVAFPKPDEHVVTVPPRPADPVTVQHTAPAHSASAPASPLLRLVTDIPVTVPPVDLSDVPTRAQDWTTGGGDPVGTGIVGAPVIATDGQVFLPAAVDKVASASPGSPAPTYPGFLKAAGVEGEALVQFVVDTLGRAESGSFTVLRASHEQFADAVRTTLPRLRFLPAEANGRKVRMVVQQVFSFSLNK